MLNKTYCDNHFTIYINQTTMLHILNLYSGICQLFLNKTKKKKTTSFSFPCLSLYNFTGSSFLYNFCSCLFCYSLPLWTPGNLRRRFFLWWTTVHQPLYPTYLVYQKFSDGVMVRELEKFHRLNFLLCMSITHILPPTHPRIRRDAILRHVTN